MQFLLELAVEEIPARMQCQAEKDFKVLFSNAFKEHGIICNEIESYITPRRQIIMADIDESTQSSTEIRRGPRENAPRQAIEGFLKSCSIDETDLVASDGYYFAHIKKEAASTKTLLGKIIEGVLHAHPWPKVMRYPGATFPWVRPIRSVLCLFDGQNLNIGIPCLNLKTVDYTSGHRFMSPKPQMVSNFNDYKAFLSEHFVLIDHKDRQEKIKESLINLAKNEGIEWIEDVSLLEEVAGLVEYPFVYLGKIDQKFMELPDCVLTTSMRVHQKYFAFKDQKTGHLAPYFGVVANYLPEDPSIMMHGFEKVLRARLTDAMFFYSVDVKVPLESYVSSLSKIVYHNQLGTLKDKLDRLSNNTFFDPSDALQKSISLCKSDLLTQMVGEFPELQGKMGHIYAKEQGEDITVAKALEDYYLPQGADDSLPKTTIGMQLSVLDKIDSLVGFLGVGIKPSGSKDPFALRRQALGLIRICLENKTFNLRQLIKKSIETYTKILIKEDTQQQVEDFILDRYVSYMQNNYSKDIIIAVLKTSTKEKINPWLLSQKISALDQFLKTEQGELLRKIYKRAAGVIDKTFELAVNPVLLEEKAEKELYESFLLAKKQSQDLLKDEQFEKALEALALLQKPLYAFFDSVLVNVEDQNIKKNRMSLVSSVITCLEEFADFSCLG